MEKIIGRKEEKQILDEVLQSKDAELVAVYGRRRIGKTYLIKTYLESHMAFELTGMLNGSMKEQLQQFAISLQKSMGSVLPIKPPDNWIAAFQALQQYLESRDKKKRSVVFLDEFPWLDSRKSGFLSAFTHFWNTWATYQSDIIVVICGSAASWMIKNVVNNKGGLHNRITQKMRLLPFTLAETEAYLKSNGVNLTRYHLLQIYMSLGGIPQYLKAVKAGESPTQVINKVCFSRNGLLTNEFNQLYGSLFERSENHIMAVRALSQTTKGLTRQEIIDACGLGSGGRRTEMLEELEQSGFIHSMLPYDRKSKDLVYRLTDEFSLFYLKFMDKTVSAGKDVWTKLSTSNAYKIWSGMAFEAVCLKHVEQIKYALGISGVITEDSMWRYVPGKGEEGAQIDLLIDRADSCINLCEMKFYSDEFTIDKSYAAELRRKVQVFSEKTKTRKALFLTMITTYGVKNNIHFTGLVQNSLTMDILFE